MKSYQVSEPTQLVDLLASIWRADRPDPFSLDLAIVPSPGFHRWLSQQLAQMNRSDGICAGVEFLAMSELESRLVDAEDPWLPRRLGWLIPQLALASTEPELEVLRRHLNAGRQSYSTGLRIARHFRGYSRHRPKMLRDWQAGRDVDSEGNPLGAHGWQAHLYRELLNELSVGPLDARDRLLQRLEAGPAEQLGPRVSALAPARLEARGLDLLAVIGKHHQVDLINWVPSPDRAAGIRQLQSPSTRELRRTEFTRPPGHPLNESLGVLGDEQALTLPPPGKAPRAGEERPEQDDLLGWLKADLKADRLPVGPRLLRPQDHSVQFHLSHGQDRQVEVLREVLTAVLADDPSLEPRHLAILTPDLDGFAPLLTAAFTAPAGLPNHPAQRFRLQVADRVIAQENPLAQLLLELLQLPLARLESASLLELCGRPSVSRKFGFGPDSHQRLTELVADSGIRWGLSATQRSGFGLGDFPQNTWIAGLQRMLLGVALPESDLVTIGTVLPLDEVESTDLALIGGLTELIGRLSRQLSEFEQPTSPAHWALRCQAALQDLVELPSDQEWQLAEVSAALSRLAEGQTASLSRAAVAYALGLDFESSPARGSFGNGNLLVAGLASLRLVPHRVIVLLGWDAECYPRSARPHGDDLLGVAPRVGDPNAAADDRATLLDAIHCAQEKLIVIAKGRSPITNEEVPLAAPLIDLGEALDLTARTSEGLGAGAAVRVIHPLQSFDPRYFDPAAPELRSSDRYAHAAAVALLREPADRPNRYRLATLPAPDLSAGVRLDDLVSFFTHPAKALLRLRAGLSFAEADELGTAIPIEPDGLAQWQVGNRILDRLRDGHDRASIAHAEWLRGEVPPFELGRRILDRVFANAAGTAEMAPRVPGSAVQHDLSLRLSGPNEAEVLLTGRVTTQSGQLQQIEYSSLQPKHRLAAWLRLLALAAAEPGDWRARVVGRGRVALYAAPPAPVARELLGRYLHLFSLGLTQPLPALPRLTMAWAQHRLSRRDPQDRLISGKGFQTCWEYDSDSHWRAFFSYPSLLDLPVGDLAVPQTNPAESTLVGALAQAIWQPILAAEVPA